MTPAKMERIAEEAAKGVLSVEEMEGSMVNAAVSLGHVLSQERREGCIDLDWAEHEAQFILQMVQGIRNKKAEECDCLKCNCGNRQREYDEDQRKAETTSIRHGGCVEDW